MKSLLLTAMITLIPTATFAVENQSRHDAYKHRRAARRAYALDVRRERYLRREPHVYRTAIAVSVPITPFIAIEEGWVRQPAIPMHPVIVLPSYPSFHSVHNVYSAPHVDAVAFARFRR